MEWIKTLNKVYEQNCYTDNGRVQVSYCKDMNIVVCKVLDDYKIIEADTYNNWGLMNKIQETIRVMLDNY